MLFVDDNQCVPLLDILSTVVPVRLVVKIGELTDEDNEKATEYSIPVSIYVKDLLFVLFIWLFIIDCDYEDSRE